MTYANYADLKANKPLRWWHDALIDYLLVHPTATGAELSAEFKRTPSYISIVMNTDMFKARFAQRRAQLNEQLGQSVQRKLLGALDLALDVVTEQMETKRAQLPFKDTSAFINTTLERLGYGVKPQAGSVAVTVNNSPQQVTVSAQELQEARNLLRRSEAAKVIEHVPVKAEAMPLEPELVEAPKSDAA